MRRASGKGVERWFPPAFRPSAGSGARLRDGSRVGVVGGGPAGSFFAYFLLDLAEMAGFTPRVDVYEARDFSQPAPAGCNMCGGIVSESLVQMLAAEGIVLPPSVIQRAIDSYVLHMDVGHVRIETPLQEMRIGAVHRGLGPRGVQPRWESFDHFLESRAEARGASVMRTRVTRLGLDGPRPTVTTLDGLTTSYDLLVVAGGVNADVLRLLDEARIGYRPPRLARTFIREYLVGEEVLGRTLGNSMHVFLLSMKGLEFAAIIPKGDYATVCLLGSGVDKKLAEAFMGAPEVRACFAGAALPERSCQCLPFINVAGVARPFADRWLVLGDCGVSRLYKDGIGSAYRTAKAAAATAAFHGISAESFARHFLPATRRILADNRLGRVAFALTHEVQRHRFARRGLLRMTEAEQRRAGRDRRMSRVLWDVFTGSAPYGTVVKRSLHPAFLGQLLWSTLSANLPGPPGGVTGSTRPRRPAAGLGGAAT